MSHSAREIINHLGKDWVCRDSKTAVSAEQILTIFESLDKVLPEKVQCYFFPVSNSINSAVLFLYFISRNINFFIGKETEKEVPGFCDKVIRFSGSTFEGEIPHAIEVSDHHDEVNAQVLIPDHGIVILKSSGTTGSPKFVKYQLPAMMLNAGKVANTFSMGPETRILVPVPINHMFGLGVGFLPAIIAGSSIYLLGNSNVVNINEAIKSFKPDLALIVPTIGKMLIKLNKNLPFKPLFICAGDKLGQDLYLEFERNVAKMINLYGCTELGTIATSPVNGTIEERMDGSMQAIENVEIMVENGTKGELLCKQDAGFDGYIDSSGRNVTIYERDSWYRTKDMGQIHPQNKFSVLDRVDQFVNRSGFLTSVKEIESAIEGLVEEVEQVIVVIDEAENVLGKSLTVFCKVTDQDIIDADRIKRICLQSMERHLVPERFFLLEQLPLLGNGKPDRLSLKRISHDRQNSIRTEN